MRGTPKYLNTLHDYIYVKENFDDWREYWQSLLDTRMSWLPTNEYKTVPAPEEAVRAIGELEPDDPGIEDDTRKVVTEEIPQYEYDEEGNPTAELDPIIKRYQYEYMLDPNCKLLRIGFTVEEVEAALGV